MKKRLLFAWIGRKTDLGAVDGKGNSPIAEVLAVRSDFDELHLLNNLSSADADRYLAWLGPKVPATCTVEVHQAKLSSPTKHGEIYEAVLDICRPIVDKAGDSAVTFHLSSGTASMHAVWLIVAETQIPATLVATSPEAGVEDVSVPFKISAELVGSHLTAFVSGTPPDLVAFKDIAHRSPEMRLLLTQAARVSRLNVPVLIEGESGTGKELLARAIHTESGRSGKFVAINCGAIPRELIESELFGHEAGAFTGATGRYLGVFEQAQRGTLFLDEVGELPLGQQVRLLRVLQEREVTRIKATTPVKLDVRILAATNRHLLGEIAEGRFREDLFYRLAVAVLKLPPLRERKGDLLLLVDRLLEKAKAQGLGDKKLSPGAKNLVSAHPWPGNVRELENTLLRAALWSPGATISVDDLRAALLVRPNRATDILNRPLGEGFDLRQLLEDVKQSYLQRAMREAGNRKTLAAKLLGLPGYQTVSNWLEKS